MNARTILLVEDNAQDEALCLRALRRNNCNITVVVVRDGQQALDYLFATGEFVATLPTDLPAIVLLDIGLPRLSGLDVLKRLRTNIRTEALRIIMFSSSDIEADRIAGYRNGADGYVIKPMDYGEYNKAVLGILTYWLCQCQCQCQCRADDVHYRNRVPDHFCCYPFPPHRTEQSPSEGA